MPVSREQAKAAVKRGRAAFEEEQARNPNPPPPPEGEQGKPKGQAKVEFPKIIMLDDCDLDTDVFWAIDDTLPRCSMMQIYGASGCGKTYLITSVSLGIGAGSWFDREAEKGCALICAFERPEDTEDRLNALRNRLGCRGVPVGMLKLGGVRLDDRTADGIIFRAKQVAAATDLPCRVITIDTQAAALGGKEDDEGLGRLRQLGERMHAETDALIVWNHHEGKSDNMGPRGHLTLADACGVWWHVEERQGGDRVVYVAKANRGPVHQHLFAFRLVPFVAGQDRKGKDITLCDLELIALEGALENGARQRFGKKDGDATGPKPNSLTGILLGKLRKLQSRNSDGVGRFTLRSHFIEGMNEERRRRGQEILIQEDAYAAFRKTLSKIQSLIEVDENGLLRLVD